MSVPRLAFAVFLIVAAIAPARAASPEQVDASVSKAVEWLYTQQKPGGHWEKNPRRTPHTQHGAAYGMDGETHGGWTALATFALLEAGEKPTDPRVAKGIAFLRTANLESVYSIGLRCMVFATLPTTPENQALLKADAKRILDARIPEGPGAGLWDYEIAVGGKRSETGKFDHSVSQFGVLGLWACNRAGVDIPVAQWREQERIWRVHQNKSGGWSYNSIASAHDSDSTPGMTCAGIATLLIIQDVLGSAPVGGGLAGGAGSAAATDVAIVRGLSWLDKNFDKVVVEGAYSLYAAERIGTAGGLRYLGRHDWYGLGVRRLLETQKKNGCWPAENSRVAATDVSETALSILFLVHGRAPVLISKLNYGAGRAGLTRDFSWNQRPRDVANLVHYTGNAAERLYNWQVVNLTAPTYDLAEVPVMYLSGSKPITLLEHERKTLKHYIESGGMILANSEAAPRDGVVGSDPFSESIIKLGESLFGYKFRELPLDHPIYTDQQFRPKQWKENPVVWGLSNGVRELIVLLPLGDHGRTWNFNGYKGAPMKFEIGANILQYAVSREPPAPKGRSHVIKPRYLLEVATTQPSTKPATQPASQPAKPPAAPAAGSDDLAVPPAPAEEYLEIPADARRLAVGRLMVGDNWDPEPGAWRRLANLLANDFKLFVNVKPVRATPAELATVKLLHWTGTTAVTLTDAERQAIANFVNSGGTLVVDAAGGSAAFADAAFEAVKATFGTQGDLIGTVLAPDDPLYRLREARIEDFKYRHYYMNRGVGRLNAPRVQGIDRAGRTTVFFSREDLTAGSVGQKTDGIRGYAPETATAIMRNIALTVAKRR